MRSNVQASRLHWRICVGESGQAMATACGRGPLVRRRTPGPADTCTAPRSPTSRMRIPWRLQGERAEDCLDKGLEAMRHIRSLCDMPQLPHRLFPSGSTQGRQERSRNVETSQRRISMRTAFSSVLVKSEFQCRRNTNVKISAELCVSEIRKSKFEMQK